MLMFDMCDQSFEFPGRGRPSVRRPDAAPRRAGRSVGRLFSFLSAGTWLLESVERLILAVFDIFFSLSLSWHQFQKVGSKIDFRRTRRIPEEKGICDSTEKWEKLRQTLEVFFFPFVGENFLSVAEGGLMEIR